MMPLDQFESALRHAILAPSSHNAQPWLFRLRADGVDVFADRSRSLSAADPEDRELTISVGAAIYNLKLAMRCQGLKTEVVYLPEPENKHLLARVIQTGQEGVRPKDLELLEQMHRRHTFRGRYEDMDIPIHVLEELEACADSENAAVRFMDSTMMRQAVAELVAAGSEIQLSNKDFRTEFASWLRRSRNSCDGIPAATMSRNSLSGFALLFCRYFDMGKIVAQHDWLAVVEAPSVAILHTRRDDVPSWLDAGQALSHLLLKANRRGLRCSYFTQPLEVNLLRERLRRDVGLVEIPQLIFRLGYAPEGFPTPRRPIAEVIIE